MAITKFSAIITRGELYKAFFALFNLLKCKASLRDKDALLKIFETKLDSMSRVIIMITVRQYSNSVHFFIDDDEDNEVLVAIYMPGRNPEEHSAICDYSQAEKRMADDGAFQWYNTMSHWKKD